MLQSKCWPNFLAVFINLPDGFLHRNQRVNGSRTWSDNRRVIEIDDWHFDKCLIISSYTCRLLSVTLPRIDWASDCTSLWSPLTNRVGCFKLISRICWLRYGSWMITFDWYFSSWIWIINEREGSSAATIQTVFVLFSTFSIYFVRNTCAITHATIKRTSVSISFSIYSDDVWICEFMSIKTFKQVTNNTLLSLQWHA